MVLMIHIIKMSKYRFNVSDYFTEIHLSFFNKFITFVKLSLLLFKNWIFYIRINCNFLLQKEKKLSHRLLTKNDLHVVVISHVIVFVKGFVRQFFSFCNKFATEKFESAQSLNIQFLKFVVLTSLIRFIKSYIKILLKVIQFLKTVYQSVTLYLLHLIR